MRVTDLIALDKTPPHPLTHSPTLPLAKAPPHPNTPSPHIPLTLSRPLTCLNHRLPAVELNAEAFGEDVHVDAELIFL